jgi:hypothetical protein
VLRNLLPWTDPYTFGPVPAFIQLIDHCDCE